MHRLEDLIIFDSSPTLIYTHLHRVKVIPIKVPIVSCMEFDILVLKFTWKIKAQEQLNYSGSTQGRKMCFSKYQVLKIW